MARINIGGLEVSEYIYGRLLEAFGEDRARGIIEAFSKKPRPCIRVNTLRITREKLRERLEKKGFSLEKIRWNPHGLRVLEAPISIGATLEYLLGFYFVQEEASMLPPLALDPKPGEIVCDMCAAPGGKTTYLAMLMENRGAIVAIDINREKTRALRSHLNRCGVENTIIYRMDARRVGELGIEFDKILLDAPCTGTGVAWKDPSALLQSRDRVERARRLQLELLEAAISVLRDGGVLVYSTCSLLPEENELVVERALELGGRLEEIPVDFGSPALDRIGDRELPQDLRKCLRLFPDRHGTSGFFVARIRF